MIDCPHLGGIHHPRSGSHATETGLSAPTIWGLYGAVNERVDSSPLGRHPLFALSQRAEEKLGQLKIGLPFVQISACLWIADLFANQGSNSFMVPKQVLGGALSPYFFFLN